MMNNLPSSVHFQNACLSVEWSQHFQKSLANDLRNLPKVSRDDLVAEWISEQKALFVACFETEAIDCPDDIHRCAQQLKAGLERFTARELHRLAVDAAYLNSVSVNISPEITQSTNRFLSAFIESLEQAAFYRQQFLKALSLGHVLTIIELSIESDSLGGSETLNDPCLPTGGPNRSRCRVSKAA